MKTEFDKDLEFGQAAENFFGKLYEKKGYYYRLNPVKTNGRKWYELSLEEQIKLKEYDMEISKDENFKDSILYEIKRDTKSLYTNNVAVEIGCVLNSKSKYFVYFFDKEMTDIFLIARKQLLQMLQSSYDGWITLGGDNNNSLMKIFRKDYFIQYGTKININ